MDKRYFPDDLDIIQFKMFPESKRYINWFGKYSFIEKIFNAMWTLFS
jgi:hypothetical protein